MLASYSAASILCIASDAMRQYYGLQANERLEQQLLLRSIQHT